MKISRTSIFAGCPSNQRRTGRAGQEVGSRRNKMTTLYFTFNGDHKLQKHCWEFFNYHRTSPAVGVNYSFKAINVPKCAYFLVCRENVSRRTSGRSERPTERTSRSTLIHRLRLGGSFIFCAVSAEGSRLDGDGGAEPVLALPQRKQIQRTPRLISIATVINNHRMS